MIHATGISKSYASKVLFKPSSFTVSDGGKDKLSRDAKDGSFRAEKMSKPEKGGTHDHHVVKGSTTGRIIEKFFSGKRR